jgi:hypothetical protein
MFIYTAVLTGKWKPRHFSVIRLPFAHRTGTSRSLLFVHLFAKKRSLLFVHLLTKKLTEIICFLTDYMDLSSMLTMDMVNHNQQNSQQPSGGQSYSYKATPLRN